MSYWNWGADEAKDRPRNKVIVRKGWQEGHDDSPAFFSGEILKDWPVPMTGPPPELAELFGVEPGRPARPILVHANGHIDWEDFYTVAEYRADREAYEDSADQESVTMFHFARLKPIPGFATTPPTKPKMGFMRLFRRSGEPESTPEPEPAPQSESVMSQAQVIGHPDFDPSDLQPDGYKAEAENAWEKAKDYVDDIPPSCMIGLLALLAMGWLK